MKRKIICFAFLTFFTCHFVSAQEKNNVKETKHHIQIDFGGHYNAFLGKKHIPFTSIDSTFNPNHNIYNIYGGFNFNNNFSVEIALQYRYDIFPFLFFTSGIGFTDRRELYTSSPDTVLYYHSLYPFHQTIISYTNNIYCFFIPVYIGYKYKFISLKAGIDIDFLRIYSFKKTNIEGEQFIRNYCGYKKLYWDKYNTIYPCIELNFGYWKLFSNVEIGAAIGARMSSNKSYDLLFKSIINFNIK